MGFWGDVGNFLNPFSGNDQYKIYDPRTWSLNPAKDIAGTFTEVRNAVGGQKYDPTNIAASLPGQNNAAQSAMASAQTQLADAQAKQYAQRQADINRALSYFAPYNDLMTKLYGTHFPGQPIGTPGMASAAMSAVDPTKQGKPPMQLPASFWSDGSGGTAPTGAAPMPGAPAAMDPLLKSYFARR